MNNEILKEYAHLKIEAADIDARLAELKPAILEAMAADALDKVPTNLGNFTIKPYRKWTYSPTVKALEENLKGKKAEEEADGTATMVETPTLEFRAAKE